MAASCSVQNKQVRLCYHTLTKKTRNGGLYPHFQNRRYFESASDKRKRLWKEWRFRRQYARMVNKTIK